MMRQNTGGICGGLRFRVGLAPAVQDFATGGTAAA